MYVRNKSRLLWIASAVGIAVMTITPAAWAEVSLTKVVELAQQHSTQVRMAQADVHKAESQASQARDAFIPSLSFGSGLPAFPEVGYTGSLPTIWDSTAQSMVFSLPQIRYIQAARSAVRATRLALKDAREQVALEASTAYIELDTVTSELDAACAQEQYATRLVAIEQQRSDTGLDPLSNLLEAQLTAAELKLKRLHLESRAATLAEQIAILTDLPIASVRTDHSSIPEIPALTAGETPVSTPGIQSSLELARSRLLVAKGDEEHQWFMPEVSFGLLYNRDTELLNNINQNFFNNKLPPDNFSSGFSIKVPLFDWGVRDKARESAAEALRAKVEAEQAQKQNDLQIATLTATLRELDAEAEVASLKQQIANEQLKAVMSQLELGNGTANQPGGPPQLSPSAEQNARIDERQRYEDSLDAGFDLNKARLNLLRALGHMQDWLDELHTK
jgi:outer membrane protein TolC